MLKEYDIESEYVQGVRIATQDSIPFIRMAAFDVANRLMTLLTAFQANSIIGNFIRARGIGVIDGIDFQNSGRVEKILKEPLQQILDQGMIPIFPCIGWNAAGKPYNLESDEIALAVAEALQAEKLFFVTDSDGFMDSRFALPPGLVKNSDGRVARLSLEEAQEVLNLNAGSSDPDLKYLTLALAACRKGTERAHVVDGRMEGAILREIFSNLGIGTMVYGNDYESIRPMKADDIGDVLRLMQPLMEEGILIKRTEDDLMARQADFVVYSIDDVVHACGVASRLRRGAGRNRRHRHQSCLRPPQHGSEDPLLSRREGGEDRHDARLRPDHPYRRLVRAVGFRRDDSGQPAGQEARNLQPCAKEPDFCTRPEGPQTHQELISTIVGAVYDRASFVDLGKARS